MPGVILSPASGEDLQDSEGTGGETTETTAGTKRQEWHAATSCCTAPAYAAAAARRGRAGRHVGGPSYEAAAAAGYDGTAAGLTTLHTLPGQDDALGYLYLQSITLINQSSILCLFVNRLSTKMNINRNKKTRKLSYEV